MKERAFQFGPDGSAVGVLSVPDGAPRTGLIVLNAGLVHRVGPSRLAVHLARLCAQRGLAAARFDHAGIGDSGIRRDRLARLEGTIVETIEVMDLMQRELGCEQFVIVGLCSGAVTAFKTAQRDERIVGACLLNSQGLDLNSDWNTYVRNRGWVRHYLSNSLFSADSWKRALTGGVQYGRIAKVFARAVGQKLRPSEEVTQINEQLTGELRGLVERRTRLLFVHSAGDHSEDYFNLLSKGALVELRKSGCMQLATIENSDHTFSLLANQADVAEEIGGWLVACQWDSGSVDSGPGDEAAQERLPEAPPSQAPSNEPEAERETGEL